MTHRRKGRVKFLDIYGVRHNRHDLIFEAYILEGNEPVRLSGDTIHKIVHLIYEASKTEAPSALDTMALGGFGQQPANREMSVLPERDYTDAERN